MGTSEKNKLSIKDWIIIILVIIIILLLIGLGIYSSLYRKASGEVVIWNDSTSIYKNKYGEEYNAKNMYILKAEELEQYNKELYAEYKSLKDNPLVITKTKIVTKFDTIYTNTDTIHKGDDLVKWTWSAQDSVFYKIKGESEIKYDYTDAKTVIQELAIEAGLTLNIIDNGRLLEVVARADNPYLQLGDMQAVVIDPTSSPTLKNYFKPKKWGIGPYIGLGVGFGYDPFHKGAGICLGGSIGIAVTYSLFQW